jgi:hypothetical protein
MIAYIVCEGTSDVELLQKTLPKELLDEVGFVAGVDYLLSSLLRDL